MPKHSLVKTETTLVKLSILGAIAFVLMFFELPLPFFPVFYKLGFDEVIVLLAGFSLGPVSAIVVESLKIILHVLFQGTQTAFVGELANFLVGLSLVLPAAILYQMKKTKKQAILGLVTGIIVMGVMGCLVNYFIALPAYSFFYQMPMKVLIDMGSALNPAIHTRFDFVLWMTLPFNLLKGTVCAIIVLILYKRIESLLALKG